MLTHKDRRNPYALKSALVGVALSAAVSLIAFTGVAQAEIATPSIDSVTTTDQAMASYCTASLPELQGAVGSEQSGHLQALRILEACYTRLGQASAANFVDWQINRDLDRADPHDE